IDLETASATIQKVVARGGSYVVAPASVDQMESAVKWPAADFSCYVEISNRTGKTLTLAGTPNAGSSFWAVPPPTTIADGARAEMWLQDEWLRSGAAGDVTYTDGVNPHALEFEFACPVTSGNRVRSPVSNFQTRPATSHGGPERPTRSDTHCRCASSRSPRSSRRRRGRRALPSSRRTPTTSRSRGVCSRHTTRTAAR